MTAPSVAQVPHALVFEPAGEADIAALVAIDQASPVPWTARDFEDEIRRERPTLFVVRVRARVAGFVVARIQPPELDIVNVAVDVACRHQGFGRRLVEDLLERAASEGVRTAFLEVRESNQPARRLYRTVGFRETQRRPSFYRDPVEAAVLMSRDIGT